MMNILQLEKNKKTKKQKNFSFLIITGKVVFIPVSWGSVSIIIFGNAKSSRSIYQNS